MPRIPVSGAAPCWHWCSSSVADQGVACKALAASRNRCGMWYTHTMHETGESPQIVPVIRHKITDR
jgi:hypothetical protein